MRKLSGADAFAEIVTNYGDDLWNTNLQNNLPIGLISLIGVSAAAILPPVLAVVLGIPRVISSGKMKSDSFPRLSF